MFNTNDFFHTLGQNTVSNHAKDLVDSVTEDSELKPIIGGLMLGLSLVRIVPLPPPVTIGLGVSVGVYSLVSQKLKLKKQQA